MKTLARLGCDLFRFLAVAAVVAVPVAIWATLLVGSGMGIPVACVVAAAVATRVCDR